MKKLEFIFLLLFTADAFAFIGHAGWLFCTQLGIVAPLVTLFIGLLVALILACVYIICAALRGIFSQMAHLPNS